MELLALSHLLLSGAKSVGELAHLLGVSNTYASQLTSALADKGFVVKDRTGKKVIVNPNMSSPFVQNFSRFVVMVGAHPPYTPMDFLEPESRRKVIWQLMDKGRTIDELRMNTEYSRTVIYDALRPFIKIGVVSVEKGERRIYSVNRALSLVEPLFQLLEFFESEIDMRALLEKISSDERVVALSVFGSQIVGKRDRLSDVDVLVVVSSPEDRNIAEKYVHPHLQLNVYSRRGIVQLVRREPWFLKLVIDGKILKGSDFLEGLERLPMTADFAEITAEILKMLDGLDRLPDGEKARVMMYCVRTAVAMKLFVDERLSQEKFIDELANGYPELSNYREYEETSRISKRKMRRSKEKILEDLEYVKKKEEEKER